MCITTTKNTLFGREHCLPWREVTPTDGGTWRKSRPRCVKNDGGQPHHTFADVHASSKSSRTHTKLINAKVGELIGVFDGL